MKVIESSLKFGRQLDSDHIPLQVSFFFWSSDQMFYLHRDVIDSDHTPLQVNLFFDVVSDQPSDHVSDQASDEPSEHNQRDPDHIQMRIERLIRSLLWSKGSHLKPTGLVWFWSQAMSCKFRQLILYIVQRYCQDFCIYSALLHCSWTCSSPWTAAQEGLFDDDDDDDYAAVIIMMMRKMKKVSVI